MKHLKKAFCLLLAAVMLLALGVPVMAAGEIPVDAEHFPDAALRTYVTDYCDTNKDNKLSAAECAAVQCIDLFEMQITKVADMTGIEHFTNLRELLACNNQITTLDLSGMTKLEKLDVSGCGKLQSLKLAGCTALTSLDASSCALTALDLTGCTALKTVACSYNDLTALDVSAAEKLLKYPVKFFPDLLELFCKLFTHSLIQFCNDSFQCLCCLHQIGMLRA